MKNETAYVKTLTALLKKVRESQTPPPAPEHDPLTHLVLAFLQWNASRTLAEAAHERLMQQMVDHNDLRVSHPHEIVGLLGASYPRAEERAARLHESLQEIYNREHGVSLSAVVARGKKQARTYLESLPGMVGYVSSRVVLLGMGGHAMPVDDRLLARLVEEQAVSEQAGTDEVAAFLERQVKAGEAASLHLAFEEWLGQEAPVLRASSTKASEPKTSAKATPPKDESEVKPPEVKTPEAKAPQTKTAEAKTTPKKTTKKTVKKSAKPRR